MSEIAEKQRLVITTSWDDGAPADLKLAELLAKYGFRGTFYVPTRNSEHRPVLDRAQIRALSQGFEIGGHSVDHVVLTGLTNAEARDQILSNKRYLEDITGKPIKGFCYVRGRYSQSIKTLVQQAGFDYARTVKSFHSGIGHDPFEIPTTIQSYPHRNIVYWKNFLRDKFTIQRADMLWGALTTKSLTERILNQAERCAYNGGCFHLWGHSWEIEEQSIWSDLESVFASLAANASPIEYATNYDVYRKYFPTAGEV